MPEAVLRYGDKEVKLPVVTGTEAEAGLDISHLSTETGLFTLDRGFGNTAEGQSCGDLHRRRGRDPASSWISDRATRRTGLLPRSLLPPDLWRTAYQEGAGGFRG